MGSDEAKRILYVQTSGTEQPERSATVFFLASSAAAMDIEVGIYFTQCGPTVPPPASTTSARAASPTPWPGRTWISSGSR